MKNISIVIRISIFAGIYGVLLSSSIHAFGQTVPKSSPTPVPSPTASPSPTPRPQTLLELQSKLRQRLLSPEFRRGQIGVKIASMNSGKVIFEENAEKYHMPASNMKSFTVAAALEKLSPDFRFVTSVYAPTGMMADGIVKGDLRIYGRGDISLSYNFLDGDYLKGIDNLADKIVLAGVKRVEGGLVGDETYFSGDALPGSWEWDDLQFYYGSEISALPLNDNVVEIVVNAGAAGSACSIRLTPANQIFTVINLCVTTAAGSVNTLRIIKKLDRNIIEVTGNIPANDNGFKGLVSVTRPAELFMALLKQRLEQKGVTFTGHARVVNSKKLLTDLPSVEIAKLESPPLSLIAAKTMKQSQNMYTETLLRALGEQLLRKTEKGQAVASNANPESSGLGIAAVKEFLIGIGVAPDGINQQDGSGLSRQNLVTPSAVVRLFTFMGKESKYSTAWRNSLTIGSVDGTLQRRFTGTRAAANVRGKTGTITQVSALSGYVTTAGGEELVFSLIVNGVPETRLRTGLIDEIVVYLANFDGKIE
ncbi:MAG: D-alanyl-D-alanine carboxypeptidase/D-alanyl-D-alanine endopeptidase [Blastocatellia bacterium]